ncbi:unnamed protein product [Paramecium primaurelia]|uniref:MHD domain-containing protein n=1 Tax=Paramecium primaurelia TaxID=5886 RepID=A0A8S1K4L8_PARPR|nr:unnamed protein product [Paramecium primaurelia]
MQKQRKCENKRTKQREQRKYIYLIQQKTMKLCSIIIQNKRGQNIFVVSSNDYSHELSLQHSKDIYNYILSQIKTGKKIDRSIVLDSNYVCICNVNKDAIFLVIVQRNELFLGYEAIKKLAEFYATYYKQEITTRKYQEMLLLLEEFLYTKEFLPQKLQFNLTVKVPVSSRCIADCDHLQKFSSLQATIEKNLIANIPLKYAKKQQIIEKEIDIINIFIKPITNLDEYKPNQEELQWKQKFKKSLYDCAFKMKSKQVHKENIFQKYKPQKPNTQYKQHAQKSTQLLNQYKGISSSDIQIMKLIFQSQIQKGQQDLSNQQNKQQSSKPIQQQHTRQINLLDYGENFTSVEAPKILPQQVQSSNEEQPKTNPIQVKPKLQQNANDLLDLDDRPHHQVQPQIQQISGPDLSFLNLSPVKQLEPCLKMLEKMIIAQKDGRLKELKIYGQIALDGDFTFDDQSNLQLLGQYWQDTYGCQRRITPNSLDLQLLNENSYKMIVKNASYKVPKGIIDYIIPTKAFSQQRIPVIFLYRLECVQSFASYCLQYKVNDQWQVPLQDIVIEVNLEKDVEYDDLKTIPVAQNITDKQITWKAKQLLQQQKGKLILNLTGIKKQGSQILNHIRISLKANTSVIENMDSIMFYNSQEYKCQKKLSVEYKIYPNS